MKPAEWSEKTSRDAMASQTRYVAGRYVLSFILMLCLMSVPVMAADAAFEETDVLAYGLLTPEAFVINDRYAVSLDTGDIYYFPDYGTAFTDGVADDGYAYDAAGRRISTVTYLIDRYADQRDRRFIIFDDPDEMCDYVTAVGTVEGDRQGGAFFYVSQVNGMILPSEEIEKAVGTPTEEYWAFIDGLAYAAEAFDDPIYAALYEVCDLLTYNEDYITATLEEAIAAGQGVCFHYVRILEDVLDALGIENEPVMGNSHSSGIDHVWLRTRNETGRWVYLDPTNPLYPGDFGVININIYLEDYTAATVRSLISR